MTKILRCPPQYFPKARSAISSAIGSAFSLPTAKLRKHKRYVPHAMVSVLTAVIGLLLYNQFAYAATYNFTQSSWTGGADTVALATHTSNQSNWTKYATSTGLTLGATVTITPTSYTFTDDGATSTSPQAPTSGGGFGNGVNASTTVAGSGVGASVGLSGTSVGFSATGGTITTYGAYTVHTFLSNGTFTVVNGSTNIDYLVIAGAGGSGSYSSVTGYVGGGGGAGGFLTGALTSFGVGSYPITVGLGGSGGVSGDRGVNGGNSIFSTITAYGGGFGGGGQTSPATYPGGSGGSGGGSGTVFGGAGVATPLGQGNNGGNKNDGFGGGGGGGAGGVGSPLGLSDSTGGAGIASSLSGVSVTYAIGGNGAGAATAGAVNSGSGGSGGGSGAGAGGSGIVIVRYLTPPAPFFSSGTYTSSIINLGGRASPSTLSHTKTTSASTTVTMDIRAGNTATPDGSWTAWTTNVASGGSIASLDGNQYMQYRANLSTIDTSVAPSLDSVTINYSQFGTGTLTSSVYNTESSANLVAAMRWTASGTSTTETVKFQVRSASTTALLATAPWCGTGIVCDSTTYFTDSIGSTPLASNHPLRSGGNDQYFQYQVVLSSGGGLTPTLTSATVQYVVNAPSEFDATYGTNGIIVSQVATSSSQDWGKVSLSYSLRDPDSTTGTVSPGFITPSFEYSTNGGSSWTAIPTGDLVAANLTNKAVNEIAYTTYSAVWTASSTLPNIYNANIKVRVNANDNEAANNVTRAVSAAFTLDTLASVSGLTLNSSTGNASAGTLILSVTDNSQVQYRLCNSSLFPSIDTEGNSCAWTTLSGNVASTSIAWLPTKSASGNETVYLQTKDSFGNMGTQTVVAPPMPASFDFKDISNASINTYREFMSWSVFQATTSSTFASYKLYHSIDGITYSVLTTITDPAINYYRHDVTTATTSTQFYKVAAFDSDGDISDYTTVLSDVPNGQGSSDTTPPTIDPASIVIPTVDLKNTSARITFTSDEIAKGKLQYKKSTESVWTTVSSLSYVIAHSIYIQGLAPNTTYNLRVKAEDVSGNTGQYISGPDFTTVGGPVITGVTEINLTDNSVTIFWNTSTSSDSYVYYSANQSIVPSTTEWSATNVTCVTDICQHKIDITGLTPGMRYYYYVKSTDGGGNSSTDDNGGIFYSFSTTLDVNPPVISGISTPVISSVASVIVWQTDEPSTSYVKWGTASGELTRTTVLDTTKANYHVVALSSDTNDTTSAVQKLVPSKPYFFKVFSSDTAGNSASSTEQTFSTTADGQVVIVTQSSGGSPAPEASKTLDTTPPAITSIEVGNLGAFNAEVKVETNEGARVLVEYGESIEYSSVEGSKEWSTSKSLRLKKLQTGTTYHYRVTATDKSGNETVSPDSTFTTLFISELSEDRSFLDKASDIQGKIEALIESALPSLSPPFVSTPTVVNITESSATISWKTNIKTFGSLRYALDKDYMTSPVYILEASSGTSKATLHTVDLDNLQPNTTYHIQATAYVFPQVIGKTPDLTFTTKASKIKASIVEKKNDSFTVAWTTTEPTTSIVEYKNLKSGETSRVTDETKRTFHSVKVANLPAATNFTVKVSGINSIGNTLDAVDTLYFMTSSDIVAPNISNFKVDNALVPGRNDRIQTVVGWLTDEPTNATIFYEEGVGSASTTVTRELSNKVESLETYTNTHIMIISNLRPGTVYRIKVVSKDASGNVKSYGPNTIITPRQTESVLDIIFKNFEDTFKFLRQ